MDLLVIGGGVFFGRAVATAAVAGGHRVCAFSRGRGPTPPEGVERLLGDRDGDLSSLGGSRSWDAVVDTCAYEPQQVRRLLSALRGRVGAYAMASSTSAYGDHDRPGLSEDDDAEGPRPADLALAAALPPGSRGSAVAYGDAYGRLKRACEHEAEAALDGHALLLRLGLLLGPGDYTGRGTYWARRMVAGGRALAPGSPDRPFQAIDVRDAAAWTLRALGQGLGGTYNVTGVAGAVTLGGLLDACASAAAPGQAAEPAWATDAFLLDRGLRPWVDLPFWIPEGRPGRRHFFGIAVGKATAAGLAFRPLEVTMRDTMVHDAEQGRPELGVGLAPEREAALLAALAEPSRERAT